MVDFYGFHVGKYTIYMDPMGYGLCNMCTPYTSVVCWESWTTIKWNVQNWYRNPPRAMECYMGVSKNTGIPKWMVKIMENPIKMDDLGVPLFLETPTCSLEHEGTCKKKINWLHILTSVFSSGCTVPVHQSCESMYGSPIPIFGSPIPIFGSPNLIRPSNRCFFPDSKGFFL